MRIADSVNNLIFTLSSPYREVGLDHTLSFLNIQLRKKLHVIWILQTNAKTYGQNIQNSKTRSPKSTNKGPANHPIIIGVVSPSPIVVFTDGEINTGLIKTVYNYLLQRFSRKLIWDIGNIYSQKIAISLFFNSQSVNFTRILRVNNTSLNSDPELFIC